MADYTKLKDLVNDTFTIKKVSPYVFKMWDNDAKTMLTSDSYKEGYRKIYPVETDKGLLDMSSSQMGQALEAVFKDGQANVIDRTFSVKSNGKTGMEIRYFINAAKTVEESKVPSDSSDEEDLLSSIPF